MGALDGKSIAMIVGFNRYRDEEFDEPRALLEQEGAQITVVSSKAGEATSKQGAKVAVDKTLDEIKATDYDAVVFIGGPGAREFFTHEKAHDLARETLEKGRLLGAICAAPHILAQAGVLHTKRATSHPGELWVLKEGGAICMSSPVERDGNIITANGPEAATAFGRALSAALAGESEEELPASRAGIVGAHAGGTVGE